MNIIGVVIIYFTHRSEFLHLVDLNAPIYLAFRHKDYIYSAIIANVAIVVPITLELILDIYLQWKSGINDYIERIQMIMVVFVAGIILIVCPESELPFIFCYVHAVQFVGCLGAILSLCNKLVPKYFTLAKVLFVQFFFSVSSIFSVISIGHQYPNIPGLLVIPTVALSVGSLLYFCYVWLASLNLGLTLTSLNNITKLSINELSCLLYVVCTLLTMVLIPGVAASTCLFNWINFDLPVVLVFIYSLAAFSLIPSCIPGRVARYYNADLLSKHSTLRYLSHEIRSPLQVVQSGVDLVLRELRGRIDDVNVIQNLNDVLYASQSAVQLLDDFLHLEKIGNGLFNISPVNTSVGDVIKKMIRPLAVFTKHKDIRLQIDSFIDDPHLSTIGVFVDNIKMAQVIRNVIINAVKFTPNYGTITVTIKIERDSILSLLPIISKTIKTNKDKDCLKIIDSSSSNNNSNNNNNNINRTTLLSKPKATRVQDICQLQQELELNRHSTILIDITDTGAGVPEHVRNQIFDEFYQFDPDKLQGGGGSGLGLWISKEIIRQHHGSLTVGPGINNIGTTFTIRLSATTMDPPPPAELDRALALTRSKKISLGSRNEDNYSSIVEEKSKSDSSCRNRHRHSLTFRCSTFNLNQNIVKLRIMIVDDSDLNRRMMRRCVQRVLLDIERDGFEVDFEEADDGEWAIELVYKSMDFGERNFDFIFMDNVMLKMNGPEAAKKMREIGYLGKIIGVTGNTQKADLEGFVRLGADVVLTKPVDMSLLLGIINARIMEIFSK